MWADSDLLGEFMESGNLVRTDMRLGQTLTEGVALRMKQTPGTIVVYHPMYALPYSCVAPTAHMVSLSLSLSVILSVIMKVDILSSSLHLPMPQN